MGGLEPDSFLDCKSASPWQVALLKSTLQNQQVFSAVREPYNPLWELYNQFQILNQTPQHKEDCPQ